MLRLSSIRSQRASIALWIANTPSSTASHTLYDVVASIKSRIAPRTAVRSSTRRSQGLRALVIGAKNYYDTPQMTIRKFVYFRIASDPGKLVRANLLVVFWLRKK